MKGPPSHWTTLKKLIYLKAARGSGPSWVWQLITGTAPLTLLGAVSHPIHSLTQYGKCVQDGTPTPDAPVPILCNNGEIKARHHSGLPLGYTLLEYIQSTGSQYINTNITGSTNAVIDMQGTPRTDEMVVFMLAPLNASSYQNGFGQYRSTMGGNFDVGTRRIYNVSYTSSSLTINGVGPLDRYIANNVNLALFGSTSSNRRISNTKLYSAKIYNNDTLVRDFIPAKNSSNVVGLYDLVSGQFFTNRGTGDFTAGAIVDDPVEIYTDGTPEVLTVRGKNLFDQSLFDTTSTQVKYTTYEIPNGTYTMSSPDMPAVSGGAANVFILAGEATSGASSNANGVNSRVPRTITVTDGKYTVAYRSSLSSNPNNPADFKWQLEQGSTATDYEPYVAPQTVTGIKMLLGVGDYKDTAEFINGIKTSKVGIYVFTGQEAFIKGSSFYTANTSILPSKAGSIKPICTHFKGISSAATRVADSLTMTVNGPSGTYTGCVYFYADRSLYATDADFQAWIAAQYAAGTPVIVVYPLATETTEQTTAHSLHTSAGTNVVDVSAAVEGVTVSVEYAKQST